MGVGFIRCQLGPLVSVLGSWDALVGWTPSDLNMDDDQYQSNMLSGEVIPCDFALALLPLTAATNANKRCTLIRHQNIPRQLYIRSSDHLFAGLRKRR
jgi:hypothetical protein